MITHMIELVSEINLSKDDKLLLYFVGPYVGGIGRIHDDGSFTWMRPFMDKEGMRDTLQWLRDRQTLLFEEKVLDR